MSNLFLKSLESKITRAIASKNLTKNARIAQVHRQEFFSNGVSPTWLNPVKQSYAAINSY